MPARPHRPPPYTSVSGITSVDDVRAIAGPTESYTMCGFGSSTSKDRRLALTVSVNEEALWESFWARLDGNESKSSERLRSVVNLKPIFAYAASQVAVSPTTTFDLKKKCLRFIAYEGSAWELGRKLSQLVACAGPHLDGLRLRMTWPPIAELRAWRKRHPKLRLAIQVNSKAFAGVRRRPKALCKRLAAYRDVMTDILFEARDAQGRMLPLAQLEEIVAQLTEAFPHCNIAVAGGLTSGVANWPMTPEKGECVTSLAPLFAKYPQLSVDAESGVRTKGAFDDVKAREYIRGVWKVFPYARPKRKRPR